jgi:hypothetical protein
MGRDRLEVPHFYENFLDTILIQMTAKLHDTNWIVTRYDHTIPLNFDLYEQF